MKYIPRPYAPEVIDFIINTPRCNVWMDPGMGKTGICLSAFDRLWLAGSNKFPVLVIAPFRVARKVWDDECRKFEDFSHFRVSQIVGDPMQRLDALNVDAEIYTINYENIPWLVEMCRRRWGFKSIIPDESTRLKGFRLRHGGKRAAALAKAAKLTSRWVNLTGTPAPQGLIDLWGPNWFIDKGARLGKSFTDFKRRWFEEDKYSMEIAPHPFAEEQIIQLISDVTINVEAEGYEEPLYHNIWVELPSKARKVYNEMERDLIVEFGDGEYIEAKTAADLSLKTLQIASGAVYYSDKMRWESLHSEKIEALKELLEELAGKPLLVAYHFKHDVARITEAIPEAKLIETEQDEDDWNQGKILCGIVHPASAGHGLNMQDGGHHIAFFSLWWNLEHYMQVIDRIGPVRQAQSGYDRRVFVYHILARGTNDEAVLDRQRTKKSIQQCIRDRVERVRLAA